MTPSRYPPAEWKGDGVSGGSFIGRPWRVVLHTTETAGMPSYNSGRAAPHLTYDPKTYTWTQHTSFDVAARALRNRLGGVQTNRANALQIEVICYSNKAIADEQPYRLWAGDLSPLQISDIQIFIKWAAEEFGFNPVGPDRTALSYAEANAPGFRVDGPTWYSSAYGVYGHQHIPEQTHWDPAALWPLVQSETIRRNMYPINRDEPGRKEDVRFYQQKLRQLGVDEVGEDGEADQVFLDAIFEFVGSPLGGSYFDGNEAAIFDRKYTRRMSRQPVVLLPDNFIAQITPLGESE
jgi:hypothetical protein